MANRGRKFPAEVLSRKEVTALLASFPPSKTGVRNRALIALLLYSQLRCNEGLDVRPGDVAWDKGSVTVLSGKGGKRRVAGIPHKILDAYIKPWMELRPAATYLFCSHKGNRLGDAYVRKMLKRQAQRAGITHRVHTHCCRHTGAYNLALAGVPVVVIQRQLGHFSSSTTARYISHLGGDEAVERVSGVEW